MDTLLKATEENLELTDEIIKDEVSLFMIAVNDFILIPPTSML